MTKRWLTARAVLVLGIVCLILGTVVALRDIHRFRENEYATFSRQSAEFASIFVKSASTWLARENASALDGAVRLFLAGSGQYVRITIGDDVALDERSDDTSIADLNLDLDVGSWENGWPRSVLRSGGLDLAVPMTLQVSGVNSVGWVQLGFSDRHAASLVRGHQALICGLAMGAWLAMMALGAIAVRLRGERRAEADSERAQVIVRGMLEIDRETCAVRLNGEEVDLTPKTFDLLTFLALHPGRTYSDAQLLEALWADAPYADSNDVKQCIYQLRQRLGAVHPDPKSIVVNIKGFGYRLEAPTEAELSRD